MGKLNPSNEGIFLYNNKDISVDQATIALNTIYDTISGAVSDFDLSTRKGARAASKHLRQNLKSILKQVNEQLRNQSDDETN